MSFDFGHFKELLPTLKAIEGLSRRKPYVSFHFVILKIPSFARIICFFFIPNIRNIDNKVRQKGDKKIRRKKFFSGWAGIQTLASTYVDVVLALV